MCNIYITSEPEYKLKQIFSTLKNFFVLDVNAFVQDLNIDLTKQSGIYLVNSEIENLILSQSKLKKYQGIIYINKNININIYKYLKQRFQKFQEINKLILIDNGQFPKHKDLLTVFDEVLFYERFRKNKIIDCSNFEIKPENNLAPIDKLSELMNEMHNE